MRLNSSQSLRAGAPASTRSVTRTATRLLLAAFLLGALIPQAGAQFTLVLSNKWSLAPGSRTYLPTSGGNPRGLAINPVTGHILIPSLVDSNHIAVLDGANGGDLGALATGGPGNGILTGGTLALLHVGVAADGVIYACNLDNATAGFKIYRWGTEDVAGIIQPQIVFGGAAPGPNTTRVGDSFCVRGAGTNTQLIASGTTSGFFTVFTTADGTNFNANQIAVPATPGSGALSRTLAFDGTSNAFWGGKPNDTKLYYISFDLGALAATTVSNITFSPAMGMCAVRSTNSVRVLAGIQDTGLVASDARNLLVYDLSNLGSPALGGTVPFGAGGSADGNITGQADIGAGMVAALSSQGGVIALQLILQSNTPPTITTAPVGVLNVFPAYNLSVGASGSQPLHYQWLASNARTNIASTFTNIPAATSTVYSVSVATTNYFEAIVTNAYGSVTSTPVLVSLLPAVTSTVVTQLWRVPAGANGYAYLSPTDNATRGIGYDTNSNRVVIGSISGGPGLYILDGITGTNIGTMDLSAATLSGLSGISIDQVVIADDAAVYACNLSQNGSVFYLNRWNSPTTTGTSTLAYSGDPGANGYERWGDTMAVRGSGTSTQLLLGSRRGAGGGTNVALLTTFDGVNFSSTVIGVTNVPANFAANGVAFGAGNSFWAKSSGGDLYQVAFDPTAQVGWVLFDYQRPGQVPSRMVGLGVDPDRNILAGVVLSDVPNDLQLFQLTGTADAPVLFEQAFFAAANANGNDNAAIALRYPRAFALDVNNGLVAITYGVPPTSAPNITSPPGNQTVYTNDPAVTLTVGVSGSLPLYFQWRLDSTNIPAATNRSYVLNYPPVTASGNYDVVVHNIAGNATSTPPAVLTVLLPTASTVVTQLWTLAPGSRPYLDGTTYGTRGLAYDPNTETVLIADHANIYVLAATNGTDLFALNTAGLPPGTFTIDQVGVADDGAVYAGNLALTGNGDTFALTRWDSVSTVAGLVQAYGPADPLPGSGDRWGDTLAVRGSGVNTEILVPSNGGTNVLLFTTADGYIFTPNPIAVAGAPAGFAGQGIAFGSNNTFWAKSASFNLRQVAYDSSTSPASGTVVQTFTAGTQINSSMDGIGVDVARNILGGVVYSDVPNDLQLLLLSGNTNSPALFQQAFFPGVNPNSQQNAVTTLKNGHAFSLDVNNGIVALAYGLPAAPPAVITGVSNHPPTGVTLTWNNCFSGHSYQVQFKNSLTDASWTNLGAPVTPLGPVGAFTDTTPSATTRYYRIQSQ